MKKYNWVFDAVSFSKLMKLINRTIDNIEFEAVNEGIKYKGISSNHAVLIEGLIILDNYDYDLCNGAKFIISLNEFNKILSNMQPGVIELSIKNNSLYITNKIKNSKKVGNYSLRLDSIEFNKFPSLNFWSDNLESNLKEIKNTKGYVSFEINTDDLSWILNSGGFYNDTIYIKYNTNTNQLDFTSEGIMGKFDIGLEKEDIFNYQSNDVKDADYSGYFTIKNLNRILVSNTNIEIGMISGDNPIFARYLYEDDSFISFTIAPRLDDV